MVGKALVCTFCNGQMQPYTGQRYSKNAGVVLVVAGILTSLFWVGVVLGVPLLLVGLYMIGAKRRLWVCKECNTAFERIQPEPERQA